MDLFADEQAGLGTDFPSFDDRPRNSADFQQLYPISSQRSSFDGARGSLDGLGQPHRGSMDSNRNMFETPIGSFKESFDEFRTSTELSGDAFSGLGMTGSSDSFGGRGMSIPSGHGSARAAHMSSASQGFDISPSPQGSFNSGRNFMGQQIGSQGSQQYQQSPSQQQQHFHQGYGSAGSTNGMQGHDNGGYLEPHVDERHQARGQQEYSPSPGPNQQQGQHVERTIKTGWLRKKPTAGWGWRKRWFVLSNSRLCYYTSPNTLGVQKMMSFDQGGLSISTGQELCELIVQCQERTLVLKAASQWECAQWIIAFQIVADELAVWGPPRAGGAPGNGTHPPPIQAMQKPIQQQKQSVGSTMKRKLADALPFGGMFGVERAAKITSPAQSREGTDHGSESSSLHSSIHGGSMHGGLDGTGHGYPAGVKSLDSSEHYASEDMGMQSWGWGPLNPPKQESNQTELLNQAAQSLEKFAIRDGTLSPTGETVASPTGEFKQIKGHLPPGTFQRTASGSQLGRAQVAQAGSRKQQVPPGARQMVNSHMSGKVEDPSEDELGQRPEGIRAPIPDIAAHRLNGIPSEQRDALLKQIKNQQTDPAEQNPQVIKASMQAMDLSLRFLAGRLAKCDVPLEVHQVLELAFTGLCDQLNGGELELKQMSSAFLTSVALRGIIVKHQIATDEWPLVVEDSSTESVITGQRIAGELICLLLPHVDMAPEAEALPAVLLPLLMICEIFERHSWPPPRCV